jgi:prepilin-type processing-associated H-X9-DG protein
MLLPALSRAKESANRISCLNHMRQIGISARLYADDNDTLYPPRTNQYRWPTLLLEFYRNTNLLTCPTDLHRGTPFTDSGSPTPADRAPRSYLINGWNDYFIETLGPDLFWSQYMAARYPRACIKESVVLKPSDTILFGEKKNLQSEQIAMDFFMDMLEGRGGNDWDRVEHGCHSNPRRAKSGGSNFAFMDGSVRFLRFGGSVWPLNLWAVSDADRQTYAFQP